MKRKLTQRKRLCACMAVCLLAIILLAPFGRAALADNPVTLSIPVYKVVFGIPASTKTFTFRLTAQNNAPMPAGSVNGVKTAIITGPGNTTFGDITYSDVGDYSYTITEITDGSDEYIYDETIYDLTVQVTWKNVAGGDLQANMYLVKHGDTAKQEKAQFTNTVLADYVIVDPPVEKHLSGAKPSSSALFTFYLKTDNAANPMPQGTENGIKSVTVAGAGTAEFGNMTFTQAGTYTYTVYEKNGGVSGYTYDSTVYHMSILVVETNGKLSATRTISNAAGASQSDLIFTNRYQVSDGPKTGDDSLAALWWILFILGLIGITATIMAIIKTKR